MVISFANGVKDKLIRGEQIKMIDNVYELGKRVFRCERVKAQEMSLDLKNKVLHMLQHGYESEDMLTLGDIAPDYSTTEIVHQESMIDTDYFTGICVSEIRYEETYDRDVYRKPDIFNQMVETVGFTEFYATFDFDDEYEKDGAMNEFCKELGADRDVLESVLNKKDIIKEKDRER